MTSFRENASYPALMIGMILGTALPTYAVDGVLEINQACVNTGCFSGDLAGFPVTIDGSAGRSYRLTGDLVVPNANASGIRIIDTHDVRVDLNGFTIIGVACVGATSSICRPTSGNGSGVIGSGAPSHGISVSNGSIVGMGFLGVALTSEGEVTGLRVRWNHFSGIQVGEGSKVSGNISRENGTRGITAGSGSTVSGNTTYGNLSDGIQTGIDCLVQGNTVRNNTGFGLNLGSATAYRENVINNNTAGTVTGGVDMGANSCNGAATCP